MDTLNTWYLMKQEDGSVFGPITLEQLKEWADSAQISPLDKISNDQSTWTKAPTIPELEMDLLLQIDESHYYGPTTVGAVREFFDAGEVNSNTIIINCKDGAQKKLNDFKIFHIDDQTPPPSTATVPGKTNIRRSLQARVRELEELLLKERAAYKTLENAYERATGKKYA